MKILEIAGFLSQTLALPWFKSNIRTLFFFSYSVARKDIKELDVQNLPKSESSPKKGKLEYFYKTPRI